MHNLNSDKIKVESLRRKKRRMKLKSKGASDSIIEKFSASSSKTAKFARASSKQKKEKGGEDDNSHSGNTAGEGKGSAS